MTECTTIVVDGVSEWKNPTVQIGDYVIFKHKYESEYNKYKVYIFRNQRAFNLCNFTQSTLLSNPNSSSSFTWYPSRPGFFYFSFNNGSTKPCQLGQKLCIRVSPSSSPPEEQPPIASPLPPNSGGFVSSSPAYSWPSHPQESNPPSPAPTAVQPGTSPAVLPGKRGGGGGGIPFISSNPAVPLPMGEVDSATISPFHTSAHHRLQNISSRCSIVVSIPACHAGDPGSIPGNGDFLFCNE
ncbi:hypothetical protein LguiB_010106 [Lonicera macranthoides]